MASNIIDKFNSMYRIDTDGCWVWIGPMHKSGYGRFKYCGNEISAHRMSFKIHNGWIPKSYGFNRSFIMQKCGNKLCVNPHHLIEEKHSKIMIMQFISNHLMTGESCRFSKLSSDDIIKIRKEWPTSSFRMIARKYGVTKTAIENIIHKRTWKHI